MHTTRLIPRPAVRKIPLPLAAALVCLLLLAACHLSHGYAHAADAAQ